MNWIGMGEGLRPQSVAPLYRKGLSQFFVRELEADGTRTLVDGLQVPELVEEHVIEHESADGQRWPFMASSGPELLRCLTSHEALRKAHARRQSTKSDLPTPTVDIAENACTTAAIVEVDTTDAMPEFDWKTAQHDAYVFLVDVVDSISAGNG